MMVTNRIKDKLKEMPLICQIGEKYRCLEQTMQIEQEQSYYERRADEFGLSVDSAIEKTKNQLRKKLAERNIFPRPKSKEDLHIVYASCPIPWDAQHIAPVLNKFGNVTTYYYSKFGFSPDEANWLNVRNKMNDHFLGFLSHLHKEKPIDLVLTYFSGYRIDCNTIERINDMGIVTVAFHLDDRLSFRGGFEGGRWTGPVDVCKSYDLSLTQAPESLVKYLVEGANVMLWPLAANQELYYPRNIPFRYDVSFVGSAHGNRKAFINYLNKNGIRVETFGAGWLNGFIPNERVPEIFSCSKINLNFGDIGYTSYQCGKCRDFEIPMSGGLMLTTYNPHLANYFEIDNEIFTFRNKEECVRQIRRLLSDSRLCDRARKEARAKALKEHTWEHRIKSLLHVFGYGGI